MEGGRGPWQEVTPGGGAGSKLGGPRSSMGREALKKEGYGGCRRGGVESGMGRGGWAVEAMREDDMR